MKEQEISDSGLSTKTIVTVYPFVILILSLVVNYFAFGVSPLLVSLPSTQIVGLLVIAAVLLVVNHSWLMTTTELTRARFNMHATPEEWEASAALLEHVSEEGWRELERRHNAHRNATENMIYFAVLAGIFVLVSPPALAAAAWIIGLLALYGMASYLVVSLVLVSYGA